MKMQLRQPQQTQHLTQSAIIEVSNLSLSYGDKDAFSDLNLSINRGHITAMIGPSGCGKSSFLQALNRLTDLIPGCRVAGSIRLDAEEILAAPCNLLALRRRVGLIFQKPQPFPLSIRKNIDYPLREHGIKNAGHRAEIVRNSLEAVGLWDEIKERLDENALALSGGQQQRLCIARALALEPEVLLFDEPCSALDPLSSGVVEDLIASLRGRYTVVIVTHNLAQARRIADDVGFFWTDQGVGRLIEYGTVGQVFNHPQHELTTAYVNGSRG